MIGRPSRLGQTSREVYILTRPEPSRDSGIEPSYQDSGTGSIPCSVEPVELPDRLEFFYRSLPISCSGRQLGCLDGQSPCSQAGQFSSRPATQKHLPGDRLRSRLSLNPFSSVLFYHLALLLATHPDRSIRGAFIHLCIF